MCNVEYVAMVTGILVFISEVLPFLDKHKSNGILHFIYVCWNSDCLKEKETLKEPEIEAEPKVEMVEIVLSSDDELYYSDDSNETETDY